MRPSTVLEDLYHYAEDSLTWQPKFDTTLTAEEQQTMGEGSPGEDNFVDTNAAMETDAAHRAAWYQLLEYTTQAAQLDWWDKNPLNGTLETNPPLIRHRNYDALLDPDFPPELRENVYRAVELLDNLARVVRFRALLARTNFGEAWNFVDFAHWFVEVFYTPISKIWL